jgi:glycosyltransferase involved in cell wall biosynthesis
LSSAPAKEDRFAIYFHPDGYTYDDKPLVGRRAAGQSFLDAWLAETAPEDMMIYADSGRAVSKFKAIASRHKDISAATYVARRAPERLAEYGTLYWPTPVLGAETWRRQAINPTGWSLMGVTHTTATAAVMDCFADYVADPIRAFDAIICTSKAVRATVERVLSVHEAHMKRRLGATRFERPQLPVIPLGINVDGFAPDEALRATTRAALGVGPEDIVVLFLGRLSYHAKAHHVPFFRAVERAARAAGKRTHIVLVGWFANESIEKRFLSGARAYAPSVTLHVLDGRKPEQRAGAWRAGDIFCSLVDNIQETFGLTPVEAMAAGMPAVVSDWDGYRETVRDALDGFRAPTIMPPAQFGGDLADDFATELSSYDEYMRDTAQRIVIDVEAAANAIASLMASADLRRKMGESGRARARSVFDWPVVLREYRALAAELNARRAAVRSAGEARGTAWAARLSPFDVFASYPTRRLAAEMRVLRSDPDAAELLPVLLADGSAEPHAARLAEVTRAVFATLPATGETKVADVIAALPKVPDHVVALRLVWLAKWGLIRLMP